jgi:hypothetical protein
LKKRGKPEKENGMKTTLGRLLGIVLCLNLPLPAMVIHNYYEEKEGGIRTESGVINDDYLFMGRELHFSGEAEDLYFLGKSLTFNGKTKLGIFALCEKLIVSGSSGNGVIAAGGDVVPDGAVRGSSFIGCRSGGLFPCLCIPRLSSCVSLWSSPFLWP